MDVMDKVYSGHYQNPVEFHADLGWVMKLPNGSYRRSSKLEYEFIANQLKRQVKSDLIQEMEIENEEKAVEVFDVTWRHLADQGIQAVVSSWRELIQIMGG